MTLTINRRRLFVKGLAGALCALAPPAAQVAFAQDQQYPPCSAGVTDHCMQRGGSGHERAHMVRHHGHHRHHRH